MVLCRGSKGDSDVAFSLPKFWGVFAMQKCL